MVGDGRGVTVIDDFAHNPDKIAATLDTLHAFPGRLLMMFQPHGYGPLKLMRDAFVDGFAERHGGGRRAARCPSRSTSAAPPTAASRSARHRRGAGGARAATPRRLPDRAACGDALLELAQPGDRIVVMGARDDTLSQFAAEVLSAGFSRLPAAPVELGWRSELRKSAKRFSARNPLQLLMIITFRFWIDLIQLVVIFIGGNTMTLHLKPIAAIVAAAASAACTSRRPATAPAARPRPMRRCR